MNKILNAAVFIFLCLICLLQIFYLGNKSGFSIRILSSAFLSDTAIWQSLPPSAIEARNLISINFIPEFSLTASLSEDLEFKQRITEYAYPARLNDQSPIILDKVENNTLSQCKLLNQPRFISIYDCTSKKH